MAEDTVGDNLDVLPVVLSDSPHSSTALESLRVLIAPMIKGLARRFE
jgi:hypothetical protein